MMADPWLRAVVARFDHHEVEPEGQGRDRAAVGHRPPIEQAVGRLPDAGAFAVIDGFLRQAEPAGAPPADLDDDEGSGRARVDRHEIEFVAADMDVPGQDGPARVAQPGTDEGLGGVTRELRNRSRPSGGLAIHG